MWRTITLVCALLATSAAVCSCATRASRGTARRKTKAIVVTGGHGFEAQPFFAMFDSFDDITYDHLALQDDSELFEDISNWDYDVIVLYNMTQNISPRRRENFVRLLRKGVGLVALHHCIAAYQNWPQYKKIIGAKYYLKEMTEAGVRHEASTYKEGLDLSMRVEKQHPVTKGLADFVIRDEAYKKCVFEPDNTILLSTTNEYSDGPIAWVRHYENARICYIQLGHGRSAYENPNYRRLVAQAIQWCAHER